MLCHVSHTVSLGYLCLKPGHYNIMSYEGLRNYRHLLAWNARESLDTDKSDDAKSKTLSLAWKIQWKIQCLAITINSQPQKNRQNSGEKTRQTFHENGQRFAKLARDWGTGRSVPSPPAPPGVFLSFGVRTSCLPQNKNWKLKIDQFSIFNFQFLDSVENRKTKPCHRLQHCRRNKIAAHFHFSLHCWHGFPLGVSAQRD